MIEYYNLKKIEFIDEKAILGLLGVYNEIGIDFNTKDNDSIIIEKETDHLKSNHFNNNTLTKPEKNALEIAVNAKDIINLKKIFENFEGCLLKKTATNFVTFEGNKNAKILIVDGPPESDEDKEGRPLVGEKGILFEKMLEAINLKRENLFITNAIPWRPPGNRYPTIDEINICKPFIFNLIYLLNPKIIFCMGEVATNQILNLNKSITNTRGKWYDFQNSFFDNLNNSKNKIIVLPTHNVSYLIKRPETKRQAWEDLKMLKNKIIEII